MSFKEQVPILKDALRLKDKSLFTVARIKRSWSRNELESLLDYADLEERNLNAAKDAIKLLNDFDRSVSRPLKKALMLEKAIEQSLDGISVEDLDRRIVFANQAWAAMHGYEISELIGKKINIFHAPEQLQNDVLPIAGKVNEKGSFKGEMGHKRKDGTIFP